MNIKIGLLVLMMYLLGCATTTDFVTGETTHNSFTLEEDIKIGKYIRDKNLHTFQQNQIAINEDKKMVANLKNIVNVLAPTSDFPDFPYNVSLIQAPDIINASAAPGGAILVYEGLYRPENKFVITNDELAAVLAHEIAHVTARHGTEELSKKKAMAKVGAVASTILNIVVGVKTGDSGLGDLAGDLFETAYDAGTFLWFPAYNREQEAEADKISIMHLARAGIHPQAAIDIWKRAAQRAAKNNNENKAENSIFASHPSSYERYKNLESLLPEAMVIYNQSRSKNDSN